MRVSQRGRGERREVTTEIARGPRANQVFVLLSGEEEVAFEGWMMGF
jgi:hypothetical protein